MKLLSYCKDSLDQSKANLLLGISFLLLFSYFPKTIPDTPGQIWHAAANPSASLHWADCRKWNFSFPICLPVSLLLLPTNTLATPSPAPLAGDWLLDLEQMADGAGTAVSYALQQSQSDLGASCLAVRERRAKGAAVLHPGSQSHFLSSFKIWVLLHVSQNRHLQVHKQRKRV